MAACSLLAHFAPTLPQNSPTRSLRLSRFPSSIRFSTSPSILQESIDRADPYFLADRRPIILFDGVCNLCNAGVNFVLDNDSSGSMRFAALQSKAGRALLQRSGRSSNDISSIVLVEKDGAYIKSEAVLRIAKYLNVPLPLIAALLDPFPLFLRDTVYEAVAANRYSFFGQTRACRLSDAKFTERFIET